MATSNDSAADPWEMDAFASKLIGTLERFRSNQEDLLYTSDFILRQEAELNDQKERAKEKIQREFPHVEPELLEDAWDVFCVELEGSAPGGLSDDKPNSASRPERDSEAHKKALRDVFDRLPDDCWREYTSALSAAILQGGAAHSSRLWSSLLTSVIADFEVLVGNLLREAICAHPRIIDDAETKYTWAQIVEFGDLDAFRSNQINKTIDKLLYGSYDDWLDFLGSRIHVVIPSLAKNDSTREIFQRRHMIVHNGGIASAQYVSASKSAAGKNVLGTELRVDPEYLLHASDRVLSIGTYLVLEVGRKFVKDMESLKHLESYVGGVISYHLLQHDRHAAIIEISELIDASTFKNSGAGYRFKVNGWLANKRLGRFDSCKKHIVEWDTSALEPLFKLAKHALLDELEAALQIAVKLRASEELPLRHWLTWPLLAELREYEEQSMTKAQQVNQDGAGATSEAA
ncbi:hypothetical protein FB478_10249 [Arthrobacter sp. AG367]|uniref:hypothetical protein n=1 Tax=Arthrobacter sp. AG367 TaxID=2572909 RepID=UPI0011A2AC67|nr:hypothetical protein [Arthrobacter sp. AG367]TWD54710.1 hypothetical protein FB478_10249 [Arthrobacter sp. AG367]